MDKEKLCEVINILLVHSNFDGEIIFEYSVSEGKITVDVFPQEADYSLEFKYSDDTLGEVRFHKGSSPFKVLDFGLSFDVWMRKIGKTLEGEYVYNKR